MSDSAREPTAGQSKPTNFAAWLDTLIPSVFANDAAFARELGTSQGTVHRWRVQELERQRDAGIAGKTGRVPTVEQMLTRHLDVVLPQRGRAPRTLADYWSKCRNDIFPAIGGQRIDRLLPEHIEEFYGRLQ